MNLVRILPVLDIYVEIWTERNKFNPQDPGPASQFDNHPKLPVLTQHFDPNFMK